MGSGNCIGQHDYLNKYEVYFFQITTLKLGSAGILWVLKDIKALSSFSVSFLSSPKV